MHDTTIDYVFDSLADLPPRESVVEIGARGSNLVFRAYCRNAKYIAVDIQADEGIDVVGNGHDYFPEEPVDTVICCSVLEHEEYPENLILSMFNMLKSEGVLILTAQSDPWPTHSGYGDGSVFFEWEHYKNISLSDLLAWMQPYFIIKDAEYRNSGDVLVTGVRRHDTSPPLHRGKYIR